jgi:hypothetical protein
MTISFPTLTDVRNWAHSAIAILGVLAMGYGIVVNIIATSDPGFQTRYANQLLLVGGILAGASKLIDSLNNAISPGAASIGQTPTP